MEKTTFVYKTLQKNKEGVVERELTAGVFLSQINSWVVDGEVLYLFLEKDIEDLQPKQVPVKIKPTKEAPNGWMMDTQMRTVKEPVTLKIEVKEDIDRFIKYATENSI